VAIADYDSATAANNRVDGTVPKTELRRYALLCDQYDLQTQQAIYELGIAAISVQAQQAQLEAAEHDLARRNVISPIDGIIVEVYPHEGEWLRPGDPIVHIVRMDQLWVEGRLDSTLHSPAAVARRAVDVIANLQGMGQRVFKGRIEFVSPMVDGDNRFKVRAVVVNEFDEPSGEWLLRPGMQTAMTIK
jgi:multidrug efflux pump subunit AcrA (membrane-fusion protein)